VSDTTEDRGAFEAGLELLEEQGYREQLLELRENADELVGALREDIDFQVAIARADTLPRLQRWFTPTTGWQHEPARTGPIGEASVGVEWSYAGTHDQDRTFNGIVATGLPVVMRGFTLIGSEDGVFRIRRYFDWAGLFGQLGLTLNWRVPVATLDEEGQPLAFLAEDDVAR